jgi:hypothetical protein
MTWLLVLSGSKGFAMPKIIVGAFIYCMLRPQFSEIITNENQQCLLMQQIIFCFCTEGA